jgi:hypothetical protein
LKTGAETARLRRSIRDRAARFVQRLARALEVTATACFLASGGWRLLAFRATNAGAAMALD